MSRTDFLLIIIMLILAHNSHAFMPSTVLVRRTSAVVRRSHSSRLFGTVSPLAQIIRLRGKVDSGYGRGGKKLGFPTANLPSSLFQDALEKVPTGVYLGWAMIEGTATTDGRSIPQKAAVNVGYSPTFEGQENEEKIVEAHLILEEEKMTDFYDEVMRLSLVGYVRPEKKFDSFPELVAAITNDIATAKATLGKVPFVFFKEESFFKDESWTGSTGGDLEASWEFQHWDDAIAK